MIFNKPIMWVMLGCAVSGCTLTQEQTGAGVGTLVGGVVGHQFGSGEGRAAMTLLGAAAGAYVGSRVGAAMDEQDRLRAQSVFETSETGQANAWDNPDTHTHHTITPTRTFHNTQQQPCREFTHQAIIGGKATSVYGTACRQADGSWHVVSTH